MAVPSVLAFAHRIVREALRPGEIAVDATMGNGHDTLFLAQLVGAGGRVYAFDVQEAALAAARKRLEAAGVPAATAAELAEAEPAATEPAAGRVILYLRDHAELAEALPPSAAGRVGAVMFNLGYLPGSDHKIVTQPETTVRALSSAARLLRPGGVISVVVYPGHAGGAEEGEAVGAWAAALPIEAWQAAEYRFLNPKNPAPYVVAVHKRQNSSGERI